MRSTNLLLLLLLAASSQYIHINSVRKFSALFNNSVGKCCLHSLYYIFLFTFTAAPASLPWLESELTIPGTKVPRNFRSQEQKERKYQGASSLDTVLTT